MNRRIILLLLSLALIIALGSSSVYSRQRKFDARVSVAITSKDFVLRNNVTRFLNSSLRSLNGVTVTDTNAAYNIRVIAIDLKDVMDQPGVALAVLITEKTDVDTLKFLVREQLKTKPQKGKPDFSAIEDLLEGPLKDLLEEMDILLENSEKKHTFYLHVGTAGSVQTDCENIVSAFDAEVLEPARKIQQSVNEKLQKTRRH